MACTGPCARRSSSAIRSTPGSWSSRTDSPVRLGVMVVGPLELLDLDTLLNDEEREIRDVVRRVADDRVRPGVAEWYESGSTPVRDLAIEFGKLGLLGMHLTGYGCAGSSAVAYGLACMELEAADSGVRSLVSVQGSLAMYAIWRFGSEEQKQRWLPGMAAGELIGCF